MKSEEAHQDAAGVQSLAAVWATESTEAAEPMDCWNSKNLEHENGPDTRENKNQASRDENGEADAADEFQDIEETETLEDVEMELARLETQRKRLVLLLKQVWEHVHA